MSKDVISEEVPKILIESPILLADEPQTLVHRFPVFNRRNTLGSSSTSPLTSSSGVSRVRGVAASIPLLKSRKCVWYLSGKCGETRKYYLLLVENGMGVAT
jgi:hypothetical protein